MPQPISHHSLFSATFHATNVEANMAYVDGFVAAVPTASLEDYRIHVRDAALAFNALGALQVIACWGDEVPQGELTIVSDGGSMREQ